MIKLSRPINLAKTSKNTKTVLEILKNEVDGNVSAALKKMAKDYTMTWVDAGINGRQLFPTTSRNLKTELEETYPIKGRQYAIKNIAEGKDVVIVELVESFPNQKNKKIYRTPLVLVLEMKKGKIRTGRHYLDPRLSGKYLSKSQIKKAYKNSKGSLTIIK